MPNVQGKQTCSTHKTIVLQSRKCIEFILKALNVIGKFSLLVLGPFEVNICFRSCFLLFNMPPSSMYDDWKELLHCSQDQGPYLVLTLGAVWKISPICTNATISHDTSSASTDIEWTGLTRRVKTEERVRKREGSLLEGK